MKVENLIKMLAALPAGSEVEIDDDRDLLVTFPKSIRKNSVRLELEQSRLREHGWGKYGLHVYTSSITFDGQRANDDA